MTEKPCPYCDHPIDEAKREQLLDRLGAELREQMARAAFGCGWAMGALSALTRAAEVALSRPPGDPAALAGLRAELDRIKAERPPSLGKLGD